MPEQKPTLDDVTLDLLRRSLSHHLRIVPVASGAGRGMCSCGWHSRVSDDGRMYAPDYYSSADIERDWRDHAGLDSRGLRRVRVRAVMAS